MKISEVPFLIKSGKKQNIFGTDGIRGAMGIEPFTYQSITGLGHAIGQWAQNKYGSVPVILLGHDTRQSCSFVKAALQTGLLLHNVLLYDAQVVPTPTVCQLLMHTKKFNLGIVISASHNPYQDNGIKLIDADRGKLALDDELQLSALFYEQSLALIRYDSFGFTHNYDQARDIYCATIAHYFDANFLCNTKIVLDCAHGATYEIAERIFTHFGAQVILINNKPTGTNINANCGALHLTSLQEAVRQQQAGIGFAFDGDGDRVIAVNKNGMIKNGDDILALLTQHPLYETQSTIVGTVMTNHGFEVWLKNQGKKLTRTPVGDKYVGEQLERETMLLGGEQSGHIILRDYLNTGDGIFTALRTLQAIIHTDNWSMETFTKFPQILINVPITIKKDLTTPYFTQLIATHEAQLHDGRLLVRYSGTESILRVMIEDADLLTAQTVANNLSQELAEALTI